MEHSNKGRGLPRTSLRCTAFPSMAALCKQPYWKSSSGELQQFVLTLCCLLIRNRAWLGRQSSGTNTQLSLELGVHKRETRVPCHERSVQGSGFFPPSLFCEKYKWWCWGRALEKCWKSCQGPWQAQQAQGSMQGCFLACSQMVLIWTPSPRSWGACKRKCRKVQGEEDQRSK